MADSTVRDGENMTTQSPVTLAWDDVEETVRGFRRAWRRGEHPAIEAYLPAGGSHRTLILAELIHEEMELRTMDGDVPSLAPYLERFPEAAGDARVVGDLVAAEAALRCRGGGPGRTVPLHRRGDAAPPALLPPDSPSRLGRYELRAIIGRGACGVVYRAWDTDLRREVALKRPTAEAMSLPSGAERFLRESRSAAGLRHPSIVPVFDVGTWDGVPYLVTALVEGRTLADELAAHRLDFRRSAEWVAALAEALDHAHALGLVHRDVKPSNVLVDARHRVYLADFGLAKSDGGETTLTVDGQVIGTPAYMAPEQAEGGNTPVDARTDVYSLGVILYELLTGTRPFAGAGAMLLARIREEEPRPPRRLDDAVPRDLETVCLKAMAKAPADRYADAASFAADLRRWLRGEPVLARPVGRLGRTWRQARRRPVVSALAASLVLTVLAGFIGVTREWRRAEAFRQRAETSLAEVQAQRDRATQALEQGHRSLWTLNHLVLGDQWGHSEPPHHHEIESVLFDQDRVYRESRDDRLMRLELGIAASHIGRLLVGRAAEPRIESVWREVHDIYEKLARDEPENIHVLVRFADCLAHQSQFLRRLGRDAEGKQLLLESAGQSRRASALARAMLARDPRSPVVRLYAADCDRALGNVELELARIPDAVAAFRRSGDLAEANLHCGRASEENGARAVLDHAFAMLLPLVQSERLDEAVTDQERLARWSELLHRDEVDPVSSRLERARIAFTIAVAEDRLDRDNEALRDFQHAAELFEQVDRMGRLAFGDRSTLAVAYHIIGRQHADHGRADRAVEPLRKAVAIREAIVRADPEDIRIRCDCTGSWYRLGDALEQSGRIPEAVDAYRTCVAHQRQIYAREPRDIKHRQFLDERLRELCRLLLTLGRRDEAAAIARERKTLWPDDPAVALSVAGALAASAMRIRPGESFWTVVLDPERRGHAIEAIAAVRDAARTAAAKSQPAAAPGG